MKHLMSVLALAAASLALPVHAADAASAASAPRALSKQNTKMAECNKNAEGKKGDERKAFMKDCLTNKQKTQQDKMKSCNAAAASMKGDERKAFMKDCLSK